MIHVSTTTLNHYIELKLVTPYAHCCITNITMATRKENITVTAR